MLRRFALVVSIAFCGSLALAVAAIAAGGGGLPPGDYTFTSTNAGAFFGTLKGGPPGQMGFSVNVFQGLNSFSPEDGKGEPVVTNSTVVQFSLFSDTSSAGACYVLTNPSDFKVNRNLQTASLHTTLTTLCPGFAAPLGKTVAPLAGGGGLPPSIRVDVTWTGLGVVSTGHDRSTFQCLKYQTQSNNTIRSANANASGTTDALVGSFATPVATVGTVDSHEDVNGVPKPNCFPL
jgi:hypothetical protein